MMRDTEAQLLVMGNSPNIRDDEDRLQGEVSVTARICWQHGFSGYCVMPALAQAGT